MTHLSSGIPSLSAAVVRALWRDGGEVALLDVREEGPFSRAHPLFAVSLPFSRLEESVYRLVPRLTVPVVVYDDGEGYALPAALRLRELGYGRVSVLEGGLQGWAADGEVFRDVNSYCKAFGELVEARKHTPSLTAEEIKSLQDQGADLLIMDSRRFEEYQTMSIPGGQSAPGGELVYRAFAHVAQAQAAGRDPLVVVNCAGRTRSIIGTQSLVNAGLPRRVVALRNGTIGWTLAGFDLAHGAQERVAIPDEDGLTQARSAARAWADKVGVRVIGVAELEQWRADPERTLVQLDVRTPEEFMIGHPAGFRHAPGGQLVQATDEYVGVRGARVVLVDDDGVRARMTASWLVQMGWRDAVVVEEGALPFDEVGWPANPVPPLPPVTWLDPADLAEKLAHERVLLLDLAVSPHYARGHIPGAHFAIRAWLPEVPVPEAGVPVVVTSPDGVLAAFAAHELERLWGRQVLALAGGTQAWQAQGRALEQGGLTGAEDDVYRRPYEGTDSPAQAMADYITWELQLVAQLERDGTSNFHPV